MEACNPLGCMKALSLASEILLDAFYSTVDGRTDLRSEALPAAAEPCPLSMSPREKPEYSWRLLLKLSRSSFSRRSSFASACTACALFRACRNFLHRPTTGY